MTEGSSWDFSDAWVLTAVVINGDEGCDLSELIGAADACNHALLTDEELCQGVGRLRASGLINQDGDRFWLTALGRAVGARRRGGLIGQVSSLEKILGRQPLVEGYWHVPREVVDAAVKTYQRRMRGR